MTLPLVTNYPEKKSAELDGSAVYDFAPVAPPAGLLPLPALTSTWSQINGPSIPSLITSHAQSDPNNVSSAATATATFTPLGVYQSTPVTFRLTVTSIPAGVNLSSDFAFNIIPQNHYLILLLDRTGSMASTIDPSPGNPTPSKWDAARLAAHVWAELFVAFRKGSSSQYKAAIMTFEADHFGWTTTQIPLGPPQIPIKIPASAQLETVEQFETDIAGDDLNLDNPAGATPIGDALLDAMTAIQTKSGVSIGANDVCIIFLVTDGMENSGNVVVNPATTPISGGQPNPHFGERRGNISTVNNVLSIYTLGIGKPGQLDEDVLNHLPKTGPSSAFYRKVDTVEDIMSGLGDMFIDSIGGAPITYDQATGTFSVSANESRIAVAVRVNAAPGFDLKWKQDPAHTTFTTATGESIVGPPLAGTTYRKHLPAGANEGFYIATVDFNAFAGPPNGPDNTKGSTWQIQRSGGGFPAAKDTLVLVDLFAAFHITFDQAEYRTGQPMLLTCRIRAGSEPVMGATVRVRVQRPGEGLGTFLSLNGARYTPRPFIVNDRRGAESFAPKSMMLQTLLAQHNMAQLAEVLVSAGIFADGTSLLIDDGAHGDAAAGDGIYANTFADTTKEGTYTFTFDIVATLPDGSTFARTYTESKWVGVEVAPWNSVVNLTAATSLAGGLVSRQIIVTPRDARGEFLGPFRTNEVAFRTTVGSFQDDLVDLPDGRYSQTLVYDRRQNPIVTITVQGKPLEPVVVEPGGGCLVAPAVWLIALLKWLIAALKKLVGIP